MSRDPNNPGGPGYPGMPYGLPYGMGMPVIIRDQSNQQLQQQPQEPPIRVQVAGMLLAQLSRKTMAQAAATETHIEVIPGQKLTEEEEATRATGLHMLSHYFAGTLVPDQWEMQSLQRDNGIPTVQFRCLCHRQDSAPNPDCLFCGGDGLMDIVVRNPRKATSDGNGNVMVGGANGKTQTVNGIPVSTAQQPPIPGQPPRRRKGPDSAAE